MTRRRFGQLLSLALPLVTASLLIAADEKTKTVVVEVDGVEGEKELGRGILCGNGGPLFLI